MTERLAQFQTIEESLVMSDLMHRGTAAITKGTTLSLSVLTKYVRFVTMQLTPMEEAISPEKYEISSWRCITHPCIVISRQHMIFLALWNKINMKKKHLMACGCR